MEEIGFFGGTFDPIHLGHVNTVVQIKELANLKEVIVCTTFLAPHKVNKPPIASAEDRLQMTYLAFEGIPYVTVSDIEIKREGLSYTIDTLKEIAEKRKGQRLRLILEEDALANFHLWKEKDEILKIAPLLIGSRSYISQGFAEKYFETFNFDLKKDYIKIKEMDISSTYIRDRLKKNLYCYHLLPKEVLDYIYKHRLYS